MKVNEYQLRPQPLRRGEVSGFRYCVPGYLKMICDDLELGLSENNMALLQNIYRRMNRDPWVSELYFASSGLKSSARSAGTIRVSDIYTDDPDAAELFSSLVSRFDAGSPKSDGMAPSLSALAEFAAMQSFFDGNENSALSVAVTSRKAPTSPLPSLAASDTICGGGYYLSVSPGIRTAGKLCGFGAMLYPFFAQNEGEFLVRSGEVCRKFALGSKRFSFMPLSGDGLIRDLAKVCDSARIDCRYLPGCPVFADEVFGGFSPSVMIFCESEDFDRLSSLCSGYGVGFCVPVQITNNKYFTVVSGEGETTVSRSLLSDLTPVYPVSLKVGEFTAAGNSVADLRNLTPGASAEPASEIRLINSRYRVRAEVLGGARLYEEIDRVLSPSCPGELFAIAGTVSSADPGTVPMILALDAACRNKKRNVVSSAFFGGISSSITVFSFTPANN